MHLAASAAESACVRGCHLCRIPKPAPIDLHVRNRCGSASGVWCERRENALRCSADIFAEVGEGADVSTVVVADGPAAAFQIDGEDVGEPDAIDRWIDTVIAFTLANRDLAIRSLR